MEGLSHTISKVEQTNIISVHFGFLKEDFMMILYQNKPNLHNKYKWTEQKFCMEKP
jgi:hypothetical protein